MAEGARSSVGGYDLIGRVGSGSTAVVYKARDAGLGRDLALKQVSRESADLLRGEAARLAALDDPHIVQVFGFVEEADAAYLVLEWVNGATLAEVLGAGGRLSGPQALGVCRGALMGLAHAHDRGVVHGDVSASNILVDTEGVSRVIDFAWGGSTPAYRAPEAALAPTPTDLTPAADVYAAAAVLVHLLTGEVTPDAAPNLDGVDGGLRPVLATALAPHAADRYPDAGAFLAALEEAATRRFGAGWWTTAGVGSLVTPAVATLVPIGGAAVAPATISAAGAGGRRMSKTAIAGIAAAVVLVGGGATAVALSGGDDDPEPVASDTTETAESSSPPEEPEPDPVVDTVPSGEYTYRSVVTKTESAAYKVGDETVRIWTIEADCTSATSCGGTITSTSGSTFEFVWDGKKMVRPMNDPSFTQQGTCSDDVTGERVGVVTIRTTTSPNPTVFRATGPFDPEAGLPETLTAKQKDTDLITRYINDVQGQLPPSQCAFATTGKVTQRTWSTVTLTLGADPAAVRSEEKRIRQEERAEQRRKNRR